MNRMVPVASLEDVPEGHARVFEVEGRRIVVCKVEGEVYAIDDLCTHDDGPLGEGALCGFEIECPRHGARFDVRSGDVRRMPAAFPVGTYPTRVDDGRILVELSDDDD